MDLTPSQSAAPGRSSALDIPISITYFRDFAAQTKTEATTSLRAIMPKLRDARSSAKATLPWLKLATFGDLRSDKNSLRSDRNVLTIHGIEGDYDAKQITMERARQIIQNAGIAAILYTSPSHTPEAPKWRVLCPTSEPLPPGERGRLLSRVNGLFVGALARESFTLSQAYYYGAIDGAEHHQVVAIDGRAIDLADELDAGAVGAPERTKPAPSPYTPPPRRDITSSDGTPYGLSGLDRECTAIMNAPDGEKHHTLNKAAYSIGGLVAAGELHEGAALNALTSALAGIRSRCEDFIAAERTLRTAFDAGKAAPRQPPARPALLRRTVEEYAPQWPEPPPYDAPPEHWQSEPEAETADMQAEAPAAPKPPRQPVFSVRTDEWAERDIPRREWIAKGFLMRGAITLVGGPGSAGKSSLMVAQTAALALGVPFGRFQPAGACRVLTANMEDDDDEQRRRYSAALRQFARMPQDFEGRLARVSPEAIGTLIQQDQATGRITFTEAWHELEDLIADHKADVVILDPLAELHTAEENDNTALRLVVAHLRALAKRHNCAVVLVHHTRKGSIAGDMDSFRGASSIVNACRAALTVTPMSEEEAEEAGIAKDLRRGFFRLDNAKANYSPATGADWHEMQEYELDNGDLVAAARPWGVPAATAVRRSEDDALMAVVLGAGRGSPAGPYSPRLAPDQPRSIAALMAKHGIMKPAAQKAALNTLLARGFTVQEFRDSDGDKRLGLRSPEGFPEAKWIEEQPE